MEISLPVAKLDPDAPAMRKAVGYDTELSDSQRATVKKNLLAKDQLDGDRYPDITFRSTSCSATTGSVKVTGSLSMHGVSKTVSTTMKVSLDQGFAADGTFKAKGSDFGFEPYTAMLGALKNLDQMVFTVKLRAS